MRYGEYERRQVGKFIDRLHFDPIDAIEIVWVGHWVVNNGLCTEFA